MSLSSISSPVFRVNAVTWALDGEPVGNQRRLRLLRYQGFSIGRCVIANRSKGASFLDACEL